MQVAASFPADGQTLDAGGALAKDHRRDPASGRRSGRPGLNGMPFPSRIRWCSLPVFPRSAGGGPVAPPPLSRGCVRHPRRPATSPARRPRAARRAGCGATGRRHRPRATGPAGAGGSVRSRTPAPAAAARPAPTSRRPRSTAGSPHLTDGGIATLVTAGRRTSARSCYALRGSPIPGGRRAAPVSTRSASGDAR